MGVSSCEWGIVASPSRRDDGHHFPVSAVGASYAAGRGEGEAHSVRLLLARQCLHVRGGSGTIKAKCGRRLSCLLCPFPLQSWG